MITAIATLLLDSLRLLRARALFWVTLGISAFVALLYLSIGFNESGMTMMFGLFGFEHSDLRAGSVFAELFYIGLFVKFIVPVWLTWVAVALGLVSTASIFPEFLSEGSVEVSLSKSCPRIVLFLTKYIGSLLFMILQVGIFTAIVFLALRWRVGTWNPSVFWVVPLATAVFSYLYAVVVLVGVLTRSSLAAVLVALVVWFLSFAMNLVEGHLYSFAFTDVGRGDPELQEMLKPWHSRTRTVYALLPKTKQTMEFADRLIVVEGSQGFSSQVFTELLMETIGLSVEAEGMDSVLRRNSGLYIIGTSLVFEVVLLAGAGWVFCRRDF